MQIILRISLFLLLTHPTFAQVPEQSSEKATVKTAKKSVRSRAIPPAVPSVVFSPDGRWLATGGADGKIRVMELE